MISLTSRPFFSTCIRYIGFIVLIILSQIAQGQKKRPTTLPPAKIVSEDKTIRIVSYEVLENGDTINKLDQNKVKHGKWLQYTEGKYSDPSMYEYGNYDNNKRSGKWMVYDTEGRIMAEENYKQGLKDGEARYFEQGALYCIGNYLALKSKYEYDTVMVENPVTNALRPVVIKASVGSVRHGLWTFYDVYTHKVERVVEYQVDEVIYEKDYSEELNKDSVTASQKLREMPHVSQKPPPNVWMQDKGKKPVKYTDIPDNVQYVKPNVRKDKK
jgi:antitoxin component YwqK of YwqJK toxin-antitoxin module